LTSLDIRVDEKLAPRDALIQAMSAILSAIVSEQNMLMDVFGFDVLEERDFVEWLREIQNIRYTQADQKTQKKMM
jgi:hypothetical protein